MDNLISDSDIAMWQEWNRTCNDIQSARGENKISLIFYKLQLEDKLVERGLLVKNY